MPDFTIWDNYRHQEYMTPGVPETLALGASAGAFSAGGLVLEVAYGKGEAACQIARRYDCRVVGIDRHDRSAHAITKAAVRSLSDRVGFARGDGTSLPARADIFDAALCTGAPSIVGLEACFAEMHRVLKPGGWLIVSDWVWRRRPVPPAAVPMSIGRAETFGLLEEYAASMRAGGFEIVLAQTLPSYVWDDYYAGMLQTYAELRLEATPEALAFAAAAWETEPRTFYDGQGREYWGYGVFIGRKIE